MTIKKIFATVIATAREATPEAIQPGSPRQPQLTRDDNAEVFMSLRIEAQAYQNRLRSLVKNE
jgi:hypothetical protein